ncbi:MAG: DUF1311 domain-containing protein [Rhodospirillaceae bacterium]|nr:DUF1311 domain-containing protein [Rhodospirillaceae bacterium]
MFRSLAILSTFALLLATPAFAQDAQPSFDCAKASTTLEHAICSDDILSGIDADLAAIYTEALAQAADPETLRAEQRDWASQRSAACGIVPGADDDMVEISSAAHTCLIELYTARMANLAEASPVAGEVPDPARLLTGLWQLSDLIEAQDPALTGSGQKGRLIRLDRHSLSTLGGAGCAGPTLQPLAEARARPLDAEEAALIAKADAAQANSVEGVAGFCLGRLFALYLPGADGSLLVADASATYRLTRLSSGTP